MKKIFFLFQLFKKQYGATTLLGQEMFCVKKVFRTKSKKIINMEMYDKNFSHDFYLTHKNKFRTNFLLVNRKVWYKKCVAMGNLLKYIFNKIKKKKSIYLYRLEKRRKNTCYYKKKKLNTKLGFAKKKRKKREKNDKPKLVTK